MWASPNIWEKSRWLLARRLILWLIRFSGELWDIIVTRSRWIRDSRIPGTPYLTNDWKIQSLTKMLTVQKRNAENARKNKQVRASETRVWGRWRYELFKQVPKYVWKKYRDAVGCQWILLMVVWSLKSWRTEQRSCRSKKIARFSKTILLMCPSGQI